MRPAKRADGGCLLSECEFSVSRFSGESLMCWWWYHAFALCSEGPGNVVRECE